MIENQILDLFSLKFNFLYLNFFKNLAKKVTADEIKKVLELKNEVVSVKIKDPNSRFETNYATVLFVKKDLL